MISNVHVSDNTAVDGVAQATFYTSAEVWFSTFVRNTSTDPEGTDAIRISNATADHVVVADNVGGDCLYTFTSTGYNLDSDGTCGFDHGLDLPTASAPMTGPVSIDGRLLALPVPGSPVLDGGEMVANCPGPDAGFTDVDLRGEDRSAVARSVSPSCDIGAIERQSTESLLFADGFERGDAVSWQ